jgi:hypothetical protein
MAIPPVVRAWDRGGVSGEWGGVPLAGRLRSAHFASVSKTALYGHC